MHNCLLTLFPLCLLLFMLIGAATSASYKGLFIMTGGTKSHTNFFGGIIDALVRHGHEITYIAPYPLKNPKVKQHLLSDHSFDKIMGNAFDVNIYKLLQVFTKHGPEMCVEAMNTDEVPIVLKEEFDYVISSMFFADCFLGPIHDMKIPLIYASPNVLMSPYSQRFGALEFSSVSPYKILPMSYPLTFKERVINAVTDLIFSLFTKTIIEPGFENLCREQKLWAPSTPSAHDLHKEASIAIINSVRALEVPQKLVPPTVIYAGGIHIKATKPLPQEIDDWIKGSGDAGIILFSLGSAVIPSQMKHEHLGIILNVFRTLDQRIIWKWDLEGIKNVPPNVKLSPWLPQQDILAHPKTRLFISHGGLLSAQEATYFGVPLVGMPVFVDQFPNVAEAVTQGWGKQINWDELSEEKFREVITSTLKNDTLHQTVKQRSKLMKDWPTSPSDEVPFWVEYVVRHKGAKHLQSPFLHMPWYEIFNVDVWLFVIALLMTVLVISCLLIKKCFSFCRKRLKMKRD